MTKLTNALLKKAADNASEGMKLSTKLADAFIERYGTTYSDADADSIIDILDYNGGSLTIDECDEIMKDAGFPTKI